MNFFRSFTIEIGRFFEDKAIKESTKVILTIHNIWLLIDNIKEKEKMIIEDEEIVEV